MIALLIAFVVSLLCAAIFLFLIGMLQIDTMFWDSIERGIGWDATIKWKWLPELNLSLKDSFRLMFSLACLGFIIALSICLYLLYSLL